MAHLTPYALAALISLSSFSPLVFADTPAYWKNAGYAAVNEDKDINKVLQRFAQNFGVDLEISGEIIGQVSEQSGAKSAVDYLNRLGLSHGFSWFVFNNVLYVSPMRDNRTARVKVSQDAIAELKPAVKGLGLFEDKFGWGEIPAAGLVLVSGPQKYIALVRQAIREGFQGGPGQNTLMVFALRHAWVDDRRVKLRDREVIIPGVASLAKKLLGGGGAMSELPGVGGTGGAASAASSLVPGGAATGLDTLTAVGGAGKARIEADIANNSLIVYDEIKRRKDYVQLVARLDVPKRLIETQLLIVDIERHALEKLRQVWQKTADNSQTNADILTPSQFRHFFLALKELEKTRQANILSSPSVLSLSSQPAVLDISESISGGSSAVNAGAGGGTNVTTAGGAAGGSTGTVLFFNARLLEGRRREEIKDPDFVALNVEINDDQVDHSARDTGPHHRRTLLNTQVTIQEGYSLLLGGHHIRVSEPRGPKVRERLLLLTPSLSDFKHRVSEADLVAEDGWLMPPQNNAAER